MSFDPVKIKDGFYWVGAVDSELRTFDIIMESPFGTTYNSFLVVGEKVALIETVKEEFYDQMKGRIDKALKECGKEKIDYVIHNHVEPDHSGSSSRVLKEYPEAIVVGSQNALTYLKSIWKYPIPTNKEIIIENSDIVDKKDYFKLDLGKGIIFEFFNAPFLHWPDSMFSYCAELNALFTCDVFGSHFSLFENKKGEKELNIFDDFNMMEYKDYYDAFQYYYECIFGPFKGYVIKGLDIIKENISKKIEFIGTSHGPVLRKNIEKVMELYQKWSEENVEDPNLVTIVYVSAYGYTKKMAEEIAKGIESVQHEDKKLKVQMIDVTKPVEKLEVEFAKSKGILFGTPTIVSDSLPNIHNLLTFPYLNPIQSMGKYCGSFGSYGWSGEGPDNIQDRLFQLKLKLPLDPLKMTFQPSSPEHLKQCNDYGKTFAENILGIKETKAKGPSFSSSATKKSGKSSFVKPTDGKMRVWKCIICGETLIAKLPPDQCPACSAEGDIWVVVRVLEDNIKEEKEEEMDSKYNGVIAVVGGGTSGVSLIKTLRMHNRLAKVLLFSNEGLPYYRPLVTKSGTVAPVYPQKWYDERNITVVKEEVVKVDGEKKELLTSEGNKFTYDRLVLATGAGSLNFFQKADNVFTIYCPQDVQKILNFDIWGKKEKVNIGIIGGGLLGIEMSELLQKEKKEKVGKISMIEIMDRILPRQLDHEGSAIYQEILKENGIDFLTSVKVDHFDIDEKTNRATKIIFKESYIEEMEVDLIMVTIGSKSNLGLAEQLGVKLVNGRAVFVNERMETSIKDVYAVGTIAQYGPFSIPNFSNATRKGEVAGKTVVDLDDVYRTVFTPYSLISFDFFASSSGKVNTDMSLKKRNGKDYLKLAFDSSDRLCGVISFGKDTSKISMDISEALNRKVSMKEAIEIFFQQGEE